MRYNILVLLVLTIFCIAIPAGAANVWTPIGPEGGEIPSLTADPRLPGVLYAGTRSGLFKSTDGGTTWVRSNQGLRRDRVYDVAVAPSDSSVVYAGMVDGVYASFDGGASWQKTAYLNGAALAVAVDPRNPRRVWAGVSTTVFWSDDAGATWNGIWSDLIAQVIDVAIDPFDPDTIYLATVGMEDHGIKGVLKSTDAGATWTPLEGGLDPYFNEDFAQLAMDPTTPGLLYVAFRSYSLEDPAITWRSTDGGATWSSTEGGYPIAVDRQGRVYAGDLRSTDHGQTWQQGAMPPDIALRYAVTVDGTLCAGLARQGVFRSRNGAATWEPARRGLYATTVMSFAVDPERPRVIYAGAYSGGLYRTLSSGAGWQRVSSGLPDRVEELYSTNVLALDPQRPQTVYVAWHLGGLARSEDGGVHWTVLRDNPESGFDPRSLVVDPTASQVLFLTGAYVGAPGEACGLARSRDRGETFQCVAAIQKEEPSILWTRVIPDPARPGTLWVTVGRQDRLWKSTDHGATWRAIRPRGLDLAGVPMSLAIDPNNPRRMFLGTGAASDTDRPERVWRSNDGGLSWQVWGRGLPGGSSVTHLLVDARQPAILYAAVSYDRDFTAPDNLSGVYWSRDGGKTFRPAGITGKVLQLTQDPKNPRKLYASITARGIYTWIRP